MDLTKINSDIISSVELAFFEKYGENVNSKLKNRFEEEKNEYLKSDYGLFIEQYLGKIRRSLNTLGHHSFLSVTYGSTIISYLLGASDINPLPLHYYCPKCKKVEFISENLTPWDIENKNCECGGIMKADGFNIPYETHKYMIDAPWASLFVGFDALDATYEIIRNYLKGYNVVEEINEHNGCKVFTVVFDKDLGKFTHFYDKNPCISVIAKSFLDEIRIYEGKTDILYSDINFNNIQVAGNELDYGILDENIFIDLKPKNKLELLKLCGMIHGTDVWTDNGEFLISSGRVSLSDIPAYREDIYNLLLPVLEKFGIDKNYAFVIMKYVRIGRITRNDIPEGIKKILNSIELPEWFNEFVSKVCYMSTKALSIELCKTRLALSYYKTR